MAAGMINISNNGGVSSCRYIMREGEAEAIFSNIGTDKKDILSKVSVMAKIEIVGSKELGIRGRHDARAMKKLIITLPNLNSTEENRRLLKKLLEQSGISEYPHLVAMHKGIKEGIENKHAHVNFFERKFEKGNSNKNRKFNGKSFAEDFRTEYQKVFNLEPGQEPRARVGRLEFQQVQTLGKELLQTEKQIRNVRFTRELEYGYTGSPTAEEHEIGTEQSHAGGTGQSQSGDNNRQFENPFLSLAEDFRRDERAAEASRAAEVEREPPEQQQRITEQDREQHSPRNEGLSR